ncbi:MAG: substrate-binding domain-containing protein [Planctomycetaceae bacterium]|nr:substrate-binding domain-containing protein [Planctomycetaceae bacterium]
MKIYCDELFWSVLWEESAQFQVIYGKQVSMRRNYLTQKLPDEVEEDPNKKRYSPAPWRNMPKGNADENKSQNDNNTTNKKNQIVLNQGTTKIIMELRNSEPGDMYLTESALQLDKLQEQSLVAREYPFCYLTMVLLVPKGNPLFLDSVKGTLTQKHRLGIIDPTINGMGHAALNIINNVSGTKDNVADNVIFFATAAELLEALEQNQIDAALVWDAWVQRASNFAEGIKLGKKNQAEITSNTNTNSNTANTANTANTSKNNDTVDQYDDSDIDVERCVLLVSIVSLTISEDESCCRRFADFLVSAEGQRILRRHGFVTTGHN